MSCRPEHAGIELAPQQNAVVGTSVGVDKPSYAVGSKAQQPLAGHGVGREDVVRSDHVVWSLDLGPGCNRRKALEPLEAWYVQRIPLCTLDSSAATRSASIISNDGLRWYNIPSQLISLAVLDRSKHMLVVSSRVQIRIYPLVIVVQCTDIVMKQIDDRSRSD